MGYKEEVEELVESGAITQEKADALLDLSMAKDAVKNFDGVSRERDDLALKLRTIERQPVRDKVFSELGVDLANLRPAERQMVASFDWEGDEPDRDKAAEFVSQWGLPTTTPQTQVDNSAVDQIVGVTSLTSLAPIGGASASVDEAIALARNAPSAEAATAILAAHGINQVELPK